MNTLKEVLLALSGAGIVIRNLEMAVEKLKDSERSIDEQISTLFMQGRSIGVLFYKDVHFHPNKLLQALDALKLKASTGQVILANLSEKPHPELANQESF